MDNKATLNHDNIFVFQYTPPRRPSVSATSEFVTKFRDSDQTKRTGLIHGNHSTGARGDLGIQLYIYGKGSRLPHAVKCKSILNISFFSLGGYHALAMVMNIWPFKCTDVSEI